jgi:hypothetical protein
MAGVPTEDTAGNTVTPTGDAMRAQAVEVMVLGVVVTTTTVAANGGVGEGASRRDMGEHVAAATLYNGGAVATEDVFDLAPKHVCANRVRPFANVTLDIDIGDQECGRLSSHPFRRDLPSWGHTNRDPFKKWVGPEFC